MYSVRRGFEAAQIRQETHDLAEIEQPTQTIGGWRQLQFSRQDFKTAELGDALWFYCPLIACCRAACALASAAIPFIMPAYMLFIAADNPTMSKVCSFRLYAAIKPL